jgi:hypothetical protein
MTEGSHLDPWAAWGQTSRARISLEGDGGISIIKSSVTAL